MNKTVTWLVLAVFSFLSGCTVIEKTDSTAAKENKETPEAISIDAEKLANAYQQELFKAIENGDRSLFCKNMIPELIKKYDQDRFKTFCELFTKEKGKIEKAEYMGFLEIGLGKVFMWKMRFEKDFYKLKDGRTMYKDTLFSMLTGQVDGKLRIFDFSFK